MKPPPEERKHSTTILSKTPSGGEKTKFKTKELNEPIRENRKSLTPFLYLTHQSVANKTSLVKELTHPLKLPVFPTIRYKNRSPPSLRALPTWPLGCVEGVSARACNKVPHCFCIDPWLLWCLVGFCDLGTTIVSSIQSLSHVPLIATP